MAPQRKKAVQPEPNRTKAFQTLVRTNREDKAKLHALAEHYGISMSDTVVLLVRNEIRREKIAVRDLDTYS